MSERVWTEEADKRSKLLYNDKLSIITCSMHLQFSLDEVGGRFGTGERKIYGVEKTPQSSGKPEVGKEV